MNKRAIIYTRVSTDEQADRGYSLRDQEARLREYCRRMDIHVVQHFQDDASAKSFERPAFKKLLQFVRANKREVDEILVVKWDRFSRDATGALGMIRTLEGYDVDVQAIEQPIDRSVPEQLMMLAIYVAAPEVENRRRSLATKAGMRRAMREGRWVNVAPIGYKTARDPNGKTIITPDERADFVREAFRLVADNPLMPVDELRRQLLKQNARTGRRVCLSRSQFHRMLQSEVYVGLIRIPSWRDEPEDVKQGLHEPLVTEHVFHRVQQRFLKVPKGRKWKLVPDLYMRGHLVCPGCSELLTGSGSRGNGGRYWYYHCHRCNQVRFRASEAHQDFLSYLRTVQLAPEVRALYKDVLGDLTKSERDVHQRSVSALLVRIKELEDRLFAVDEAFIERRIEGDSYSRMKERYANELRAARTDLEEVKGLSSGFVDKLEFALSLLSDLSAIFDRASVETRREMLVRLWPDHLWYENRSFRTKPESDIIALLAPKLQKTKNGRRPKASAVSCGSPGRRRRVLVTRGDAWRKAAPGPIRRGGGEAPARRSVVLSGR